MRASRKHTTTRLGSQAFYCPRWVYVAYIFPLTFLGLGVAIWAVERRLPSPIMLLSFAGMFAAFHAHELWIRGRYPMVVLTRRAIGLLRPKCRNSSYEWVRMDEIVGVKLRRSCVRIQLRPAQRRKNKWVWITLAEMSRADQRHLVDLLQGLALPHLSAVFE